jgi:excisionase family DNA binding protein
MQTTPRIENLLTIKNYADKAGVTRSYIYKLVKEGKMEVVDIDGVKFIDTKKYPALPTRK